MKRGGVSGRLGAAGWSGARGRALKACQIWQHFLIAPLLPSASPLNEGIRASGPLAMHYLGQ